MWKRSSGQWILDPFAGSGTTGIASTLLGRRFLGIEQDESFIEMSRMRREELNLPQVAELYRSKIKDLNKLNFTVNEEESLYGDLPF